nr:hypothetical protein [Tanacetum cinerariifolium]
MSDSEHSSVTYTSIPSPVEDYSDIGSPEVDRPPSPDYVPGPEEPEQAPLSPDYVPSPKEPEQAPPSPVYLPYVPKLVYPEYMPPEDDEVGESSVAGAARQDEPAVARDDPYSLVREELYEFFDRVDVAPRRPMSKELDYGITDTWDELVAI